MLNCAAEIESCRISIGPSGIMIMKSIMCVNCTAASRISSDRSERCVLEKNGTGHPFSPAPREMTRNLFFKASQPSAAVWSE